MFLVCHFCGSKKTMATTGARLAYLFAVLGWMFGGFEATRSWHVKQPSKEITHRSLLWKIGRKSFQIIRLISESSLARVLGISSYLSTLIEVRRSSLPVFLSLTMVHWSLFVIVRRKKKNSCPVLLGHVVTENSCIAHRWIPLPSHCIRPQSSAANRELM